MIATKAQQQLAAKMIPASQAAQRLGISRESLVRRIQRGDLTGAMIDGYWWVDRSALERATRERRAAGE